MTALEQGRSGRTLGIVGGMGPLASAEFLSTLYRLQPAVCDQEAPACILFSDPRFPDRTDEILRGNTATLAHALEDSLERLLTAGADRIVIACVTVHVVLPAMPLRLRRRVVSLLDVIADECRARPARRLLLASNGTRSARLLESHPRWPDIAAHLCVPSDDEQEALHASLYALKAGSPPSERLEWLDELRRRHNAEETVFACTELHLLHRAAAGEGHPPLPAVDPLWVVARDLKAVLAGAPDDVPRAL